MKTKKAALIALMTTLCACSSAPRSDNHALNADNDPKIVTKDVSGLSEIDQANYFVENRQFDSAIIHFEYALTNRSWAAKHGPVWNAGLKKLMAIVMQVKKDPSLALELLSRLSETKATPAAYAEEVQTWKTQFRALRSQKQSPSLKAGDVQKVSNG